MKLGCQMHLFSAGNVGHLALSQYIAYDLRKKGYPCYLLHNTNKSFDENEYFVRAYEKLVVPELWDGVWYLRDGGMYSYTYVWPKIVNPIKSHSILSKIEGKINQILEQIPNLSDIYIYHFNSPKNQYLWDLAQKSGIRVHVVDNGYATNMTVPYKSTLENLDANILSKARRFLSGLFLKATGRKPWVLFRHDYVFHPMMKFDNLYSLFPEKYPHNNIRGLSIKLNQVVTREAIDYFIGHLLKSGILSADPDMLDIPCLFISRPDDEDTFLSTQDQIEITRAVLLELVKRYESIVIKPHPREDMEKIKMCASGIPGVSIFEDEAIIPLEVLAYAYNIHFGYGSWSYGLMTLSEINRVKSYALIPLYIKELKKRGRDVRKFERVFKQNYGLYKNDLEWIFDWDNFPSL